MTPINLTNEGILGRIAQGKIDIDINRWMSAVKEEEVFSSENIKYTHTHADAHTHAYI